MTLENQRWVTVGEKGLPCRTEGINTGLRQGHYIVGSLLPTCEACVIWNCHQVLGWKNIQPEVGLSQRLCVFQGNL